MHYLDISNEEKSVYRLKANEQVCLFLFNRSGKITIELAEPGATARVYALYFGKGKTQQSLTLIQKHLAPDTLSSALIKSALDDQSTFSYDGAIEITPSAHRSDASQESRALLLSPDARATARPALEILAHDVSCHHAATTSPINAETLYFAQTRGLSKATAQHLIIEGFFMEALEQMNAHNIDTAPIRKQVSASISSRSLEIYNH